MIYTFRAETADDADTATAIALPSAKTLDQWQDDGTWWFKVWTDDRELPRKIRPYARLERREW
ncbi:MAG: hypothetical protein OHK0037_27740 [Elainellaceae cyanobacterium]